MAQMHGDGLLDGVHVHVVVGFCSVHMGEDGLRRRPLPEFSSSWRSVGPSVSGRSRSDVAQSFFDGEMDIESSSSLRTGGLRNGETAEKRRLTQHLCLYCGGEGHTTTIPRDEYHPVSAQSCTFHSHACPNSNPKTSHFSTSAHRLCRELHLSSNSSKTQPPEETLLRRNTFRRPWRSTFRRLSNNV